VQNPNSYKLVAKFVKLVRQDSLSVRDSSVHMNVGRHTKPGSSNDTVATLLLSGKN
jgi:hypothetical protein